MVMWIPLSNPFEFSMGPLNFLLKTRPRPQNASIFILKQQKNDEWIIYVEDGKF